MTALVLGAMAPDFEYFFRWQAVGLFGHNLEGFIYFNLPLCFLIAYIFHFIMKKPMIECLPHPLNNWYWYFAERKWGLHNTWSLLIFIYSALLGMVTHVFWDSFTHSYGWFVEQFPMLSNVIYLNGDALPVYNILQLGSSLVGLMILVVFCYHLRNQQTKVPRVISSWIKGIFYGTTILAGCIACLPVFFTYGLHGFGTAGVYSIAFINGLVLGGLLASIAYQYILRYD